MAIPRGTCSGAALLLAVLTACGGGGGGGDDPPPVHTVTASVTGDGSITAAGLDLNCPGDCSADAPENTNVSLTATPAPHSTFGGWDSGPCAGSSDPECSFFLLADQAVSASFTPIMFTVEVSVSGSGSVASDDGNLDCGTVCAAAWQEGSAVTLLATPDQYHEFVAWSGGPCDGETNPQCSFVVSGDETITATFAPAMYTVTAAVTGSGSVTSDISGIDCGLDCDEEWQEGTAVTLSATPDQYHEFVAWSGGSCDGDTNPQCSIVVSGDEVIRAEFQPILHTVTLAVVGPTEAGAVTGDAGGLSCPGSCSADLPEGSTLTLTANEVLGWQFTSWSGGPCDGSVDETCVLPVDGPLAVTANYVQVMYTVTAAVTGSGGVTSDISGIDCGLDCEEIWQEGTGITLSATPEEGYAF
ncbi:MAG: hypothetical protein QF599_02320, partial [Planctomycetota bacterium]|nr:hypothetical protein [Planctomycetota bacterium]